jgi:hypothetical protein
MKDILVKKVEAGAHYFLQGIRSEYAGTKAAGAIIHKYMRSGKISATDEQILKKQLADSLKIIGIVIPFVLLPGASILMPVLIKVARKHNIQLMPTSFRYADKVEESAA